ncbi:probable leucine--tRNA ligase, mitochondrial isoform X2 [Mya arenaria]|nr:probable leucine--tRNA ligase, mitochondrial isoform X2 [Mya arenaria]XP_052816182.1 probable leucine--tRNA ligase, mitochondrial isoform X2 [Mya arenaria]XP_052816183.1 probable leucine--tRNA ligase, mitochondrial isoform X2 [Mya arenaria]
MLGQLTVTWNVLKHCRIFLQQLRGLASLYEQNGKWVPQLKNNTMLDIENAWKTQLQQYDRSEQSRLKNNGNEKFYVLSMFPYPSGKLHMGHVRVYTISDMMARYHRMLGHQVVHPMGFDAFGLPAENAAIERNLHPKEWTYSNISVMKRQLGNLCCNFDWDREVTTCDPGYYRWTQYIFLRMYEAGLVYQRQASVNWDPVDETVLADEQIDDEGQAWRSGALAERRYLKQWYIQTTAYAKSLLDGLDTVSSELWKDVIELQRNWIGQCTGCRLDFKLKGGDAEDVLSIFTETPEAVYGISHIVLPTSHRYNQLQYYKHTGESCCKYQELTIQAIHPMTGHCLPILVAMETEGEKEEPRLGVPSWSETDREVADSFEFSWWHICSDDKMVNSQQFDGLTRQETREAVMALAREGGFGGHPVSSHLRDWLISRQRYWGTPIPIIHCPECKAVPVPYEDLPVELPESTTTGHNALKKNTDWLNVTCPKCGGPAKRETDTMDTFVDSSWYFLRYLNKSNLDLPISKERADAYMPVDLYIGGKEHAYLHLYYARFFNHFLCDIGLTSHREPFVNLLTQGMIRGESYKVARTGVYLPPDKVEKTGIQYTEKGTGEKVVVKFEKMSKSKHNGVDPEELFTQYGADMTRLCILSNVAPKSDRNWNNEVYIGVQKWLHRVWTLVGVLVEPVAKQPVSHDLVSQWDKKIKEFRNKYLLEIRYHLDWTFLFNTAISRMQELTTDLKKVPDDVAVISEEYKRAVRDLVIMITPAAPMISMECWAALQHTGIAEKDVLVLEEKWPEVDEDAVYWLNVQVNKRHTIGKLPLSHKAFRALSEQNVIYILGHEDFFLNTVKNNEIVHTQLVVKPNLSAQVNLSIPSLEFELENKTKGKKKGGKKGKQQHQDSESADVKQYR